MAQLARYLFAGSLVDEAQCRPEHLDLAVPARPNTLTNIMANYPLPWARASNASYFGGSGATLQPEGLMAERGTLYPATLAFGRPALYVENGEASIAVKEDPHRARASSMAVGGGPVLMRDGQATALAGLLRLGSFLGLMPDTKRPRNLLGILPNGDIWHACTEGHTLAECQELGMQRGVRNLMNLDGGDSVGLLSYRALTLGKATRYLPSALVMRELTSREATTIDKPHVRPYVKLSEHFHESEFYCKCCGRVWVDPRLVDLLERVRTRLGNVPITVTPHGGCRCPQQNALIGGARQSFHLMTDGQPCRAADVTVKGKTPKQVFAVAEAEGAGGIHAYPEGFCHVDVGPARRW